MLQRLKYLVSSFVLAIFLLYMVPHEVVHAFYDHQDTEHCESHTGNSEFSTIHIHCDFLSFYTGEFLPAEQVPHIECTCEIAVTHKDAAVAPIKSILQLRESRGPPSVF